MSNRGSLIKNNKKLPGKIDFNNLVNKFSSFEEIYSITKKDKPNPIGWVDFNDKNSVFLISWVEDFAAKNIKVIDNYSVKIRNYPINGYPVLALTVGIHNGKVDPKTGEDLWYYKNSFMDISDPIVRGKLYSLINSKEIVFSIFNNTPEELDSFGFKLDEEELTAIESEITSAISQWEGEINNFEDLATVVAENFGVNGLPLKREALNIYLSRKALSPKPHIHNWGDFTSV